MSKMKVFIFHTGQVVVDRAVPLHEKNPLAPTGFFRGKDKKMTLPVSCYLLLHKKGNVLIDTGWDAKYVHEKPTAYFGLVNKVSRPILCDGESVDCRLRDLGLRAEDLDYVFFSHLDLDHVSAVACVKGAKNFFASSEEIAAASKPSFRYMKEYWSEVDLQPFYFENTGIGPVGKSYDVFGDGAIRLVATPGHTHGHCSAKITGEGGKYIVLAGDAAYLPQSYSEKIIPGFSVDNALSLKSLEWLIECRADPQCLGVFANHDPTVSEQILEL